MQASISQGLILLGAAPCTAMVFVWSQLTKGDPNYTLVQVSLNDVIMVFAFAPIVALLLGVTDIAVPWETLVLSVVLYVVLPLAAGVVTRSRLMRRGGEGAVSAFTARIKPVSVLGLLMTVVLLFGFQGSVITGNPLLIVLLATPILIQSYGIFAIAYFWAWRWKVPHKVAAPCALIGTSNFFELAVAVAIGLFGLNSGAALVTVVGVLVEVPVMLSLVWFANRTRGALCGMSVVIYPQSGLRDIPQNFGDPARCGRVEPTVIDYLETGLDACAALGSCSLAANPDPPGGNCAFARSPAESLGLTAPDVPNEVLLAAMVEHPDPGQPALRLHAQGRFGCAGRPKPFLTCLTHCRRAPFAKEGTGSSSSMIGEIELSDEPLTMPKLDEQHFRVHRPRNACGPPALSAHPPRILILYGSLRASFIQPNCPAEEGWAHPDAAGGRGAVFSIRPVCRWLMMGSMRATQKSASCAIWWSGARAWSGQARNVTAP